ncbi:MAG: hypothetical protein IIX48_07960 [Lachnospiraceae bacterium]|nr:hypothetical protein [Lachnospiraceae bacterium]
MLLFTLPYNHTVVMLPIEKMKLFLVNSAGDGIVMSKQFSNAIEFCGDETEKIALWVNAEDSAVLANLEAKDFIHM